MVSKILNQGQILAVRLDCGEEIIESILKVAAQYHIRTGVISGIGAISEATLFLFQCSTRAFIQNAFRDDLEVVSLSGNLTMKDGAHYAHIHTVLANASAQTFGGHLVHAKVSATVELFIQIIPETIERAFSEEIGINLMEI
jgi:uncharacterized protein